MFFMGLFVFYLEAFLDREEEKTKVDHETPKKHLRGDWLINTLICKVQVCRCKLSILLKFASRH